MHYVLIVSIQSLTWRMMEVVTSFIKFGYSVSYDELNCGDVKQLNYYCNFCSVEIERFTLLDQVWYSCQVNWGILVPHFQ